MKINRINNFTTEQKNSIRKNNSFQASFHIKPYEDISILDAFPLIAELYGKLFRKPAPNPYKNLELYIKGMLAPIKPYNSKVVLNVYDEAGNAEIACFPPNENMIGKSYVAKVGNIHSQNIATNVYNEAKPILDFIYKKFC